MPEIPEMDEASGIWRTKGANFLGKIASRPCPPVGHLLDDGDFFRESPKKCSDHSGRGIIAAICPEISLFLTIL